MKLTSKHFLLCVLLCTTFGLSAIFGAHQVSFRAPEAQSHYQTLLNPKLQYQNNNKQIRAISKQLFFPAAFQNCVTKLLKRYQATLITLLHLQTQTFLTTKAKLLHKIKATFNTQLFIDSPRITSHF